MPISFDQDLVSGGDVSVYLIMWNVKDSVDCHSFLAAPDNILHCNVRGNAIRLQVEHQKVQV